MKHTFKITWSMILKAAVIMFLIVIICAICCIAGLMIFTPSIDEEDVKPSGYQTQILDEDGSKVQTLSGQASNRIYASLSEIPENLQNAFIAVEDSRFYSHHGVDTKAILRAAVVGITQGHFTEGGSTITQQLIKNNVLTTWTEEECFLDKLTRKMQEQYLALELETKTSKEYILESYLNTINLGGGTYGVQAASKYYFGKDVSELSLSECAVLAGITQNPTEYNPLLNPENNETRREIVLSDMADQGYITDEEYEEALADDVYTRIAENETESDTDEVMSYFEDAMVKTVAEDLMTTYGYTEEEAWDLIYRGGLTIQSTMDSNLQKICEEEVNNDEWYDSDAQTSLVLIDQSTGEVKALVGGRGEKTADLVLNRATDSERQIGSVMKIIGEYSAAIDTGKLTLGSVLEDSPYTYENGTEVHNADGIYDGRITLRNAITESNNIAAIRAMNLVGIDTTYEYLKDYGISTLSEKDKDETLAIGGTTHGLTNLEVTAAYAAIANEGVYSSPIFYTEVKDHDGNILLAREQTFREVIQPSTAKLLTSAMRDVINYGTGTQAYFENMAIAGKSGTTNDNKDAWFVGFSPYYTCGIWGGYDDNSEQDSGTYVKYIWKAVMERAHESLDYKSFDETDGMISATICTKCGKLAITGTCDSTVQGDMTCNEIYESGTEPTEYCDCHEKVQICTASGAKAGFYCPSSSKETKVYLKDAVAGTDEENYVAASSLSGTCTTHTSIWSKWFGDSDEDDDTAKNEDSEDSEMQDDPEDTYNYDDAEDDFGMNDDYDSSYGSGYNSWAERFRNFWGY